MARLTISIPNDLKRMLTSAAQREKISVHAYLVKVVKQSLRPKRWSKEFLATWGSWSGTLCVPPEVGFELRADLELRGRRTRAR